MKISNFRHNKLLPKGIDDNLNFEKTRDEFCQIFSKGISDTDTNISLYTLVRLLKPNFCLELGTKIGMSAYSIAFALKENKKGTLFTIDFNKEFLRTAYYLLKKKKLDGFVKVVYSDTKNPKLISYLKLNNNKIDFLFIDTKHIYEQLKEELILFKDYVSQNGIIALHDYCDNFPGIIKASNEILKEEEWIKIPYSGVFDLGIFQKK